MTANHKRVVLEKYPEAGILFNGTHRMYEIYTINPDAEIGFGKTIDAAWQDAAQRLQETGK